MDEQITIKNIRLEIETLQFQAQQRAEIASRGSSGKSTLYASELKTAETCTEILKIIDAHLDLQVDVEELLTRDIGRFVICTDTAPVRRGRIKAWSSGLNLCHVVFERIDESDWIEQKSERVFPDFMRFESADLIQQNG